MLLQAVTLALSSLGFSASAIDAGPLASVQAQGAPQSGEPRPDVLKAICASSFGQGEFARVDVFRNPAGAVAVLALRPDIRRFTHAPHTYYGPDGAVLLVVPERPAAPDDPVIQKQDALLKGMKAAGSIYCDRHR